MTLDYPRGGSGAIVDALVRGITKHKDCHVILRKHVSEIILENNEVIGVGYVNTNSKISNNSDNKQGQNSDPNAPTTYLKAKVAVVSNIDPWKTRSLIPIGVNTEFDMLMSKLTQDTPMLASFIHLHAGMCSICEKYMYICCIHGMYVPVIYSVYIQIKHQYIDNIAYY